ncbi:hypothetical protein QP794_32575, partial [Paenibacillus sp. UMB7766-LJ446]|uniref:hypothetical protein n=1 Tax=Paenibacillus sp. UMB7766-LJ446 TaxID=3046313 RepID=UPI00254B0DC1
EAYLFRLPHRVSRVFLAGIRIYHVQFLNASFIFIFYKFISYILSPPIPSIHPQYDKSWTKPEKRA